MELMHYDSKTNSRVCDYCLDGFPDENPGPTEEHRDDTECIYCGSYNTTEQAPKWCWYKCNDCGATFRRF